MADLKISDELLILATIVGPILAVQAQKFVERATENRRRLGIFYTLMGTRAARVAPDHVQALNRIDLEFSGKRFFGLIDWQTVRERAVVEAWREHFDRLSEQSPDEKTTEPSVLEAWIREWNVRCDDLFVELLHALSKCMGFKFDKVQLRRGVYWPKAHGEAETLQRMIQNNLANILAGRAALSMNVVGFPSSQEALDAQVGLQRAMLEALSGSGLPVTLRRAPTQRD